MKHVLHSLYITAMLHASFFATAQVTKLANNNDILFGAPLGNKAIMVSKDSLLWSTDGTAANTLNYATNVKADFNRGLAFFSNKIFFAGINAKGSELWVTNGLPAGTKIVKDILTGANGSTPTDFFVYNNALYFFAKTTANGMELWQSDGTAAGTKMLKDINPGNAGSYSNSANFFVNNNILYFIANDGTNGAELWKTNGTAGGTVLVKNINPGAASSSISGFTALGTQVIFSANDGSNGQELWITNGTAAGTKLVKDIESTFPNFGSSPGGFYLFNGKLYFQALTFANGIELWVTNGKSAGTKMVKDINPNNGSSVPFTFDAVTINSKFYFPATTNAQGTELWGSNGAAAGTTLVKDIRAGSASSNSLIFLDFLNGTSHLFNGKIFLSANNGTNGTELWITDGTASGTKQVKDINPGAGSSLPSITDTTDLLRYYYTSSALYFAATNGTKGIELWQSDGTSAGTKIVKDINTGAGSSSPLIFTFFKNHLLFTADDGDNPAHKTDLFQLNAAVDTLAAASTAVAESDMNIAPDGTTFSVYPNPATDHLSVTVNSVTDKTSSLAITSLQGKQLYTQQLQNGKGTAQYNINVKSLSPGLYYLQLITGRGMKSVKFIKE